MNASTLRDDKSTGSISHNVWSVLLLHMWEVLSSKLGVESNSSEVFLGFSQYFQEN
jgi:hypothetical protein